MSRKNQQNNKKNQHQNNPLFEHLKNKESNSIQTQEMMSFFEQVGIDPSDPFTGYLFYLMKSQSNNSIQKQEFQLLTEYMDVYTIDDFKKKLPVLRKEFASPQIFKNVYQYLFDLYKQDSEKKILPFELASQLWTIYLTDRYQLSKKFFEYLETAAEKKPVTRDTWNLVNQFISITNEDMSNYNEMEGWPVFIDNFALFVKEKQ